MAFPEELKAAFPSYGPGWDAAVEAGIDVSLLLEALSLTPTERLERLQSKLDLVADIRRSVRSSDAQDP